jgi:poly(ADP-ribose) glycohydrolase ARH3
MSRSLQDRFRGCLLGLAVGDALGGRFEAQLPEAMRSRFANITDLMNHLREELWYTDDTQMTIAVAEELLAHGAITEAGLCAAFVANYVPSRGYGRGARAILEAMEEGGDHRAVAARYFPGGSYGNGAAMRVAPVGLVFRRDVQRLREQARLSAEPTHLHPFGIEGARLLARAVALAVESENFDRKVFFETLIAECISEEFRSRLRLASTVQTPADLAGLGNGIEALESVPTAIASFALAPESFEATVGQVVMLGGDTGTLAAMAGALSGAFIGVSGLPSRLVGLLEQSPKGRAYITDLADRLHRI